jgi:CDP-diacylglycerol--serine O-phosphatidyltransferase
MIYHPPFEPDRRRLLRRPRFRAIPVRTLVPNVITLLALCAGLTAIRLAVEDRLEWALAAIVFAAMLDGIDGRVARMLKGTSRFGAELDSLADFVNFGVAPALILYFWRLHELKSAGWIAALVFAICAALRLARFNVMIEDPNRPAWAGNYFVGVPAPAGAITVLLPLYLDGLGLFDVHSWPWLIALYTATMAAMLVSTIPTFSGKLMGERIAGEFVLPIFVGVAALVALLVTYPYGTLTLVTLLYLAAIPISYRRFAQKLQEPVQQAATGADVVRAPGESPAAGDIPVGETKH